MVKLTFVSDNTAMGPIFVKLIKKIDLFSDLTSNQIEKIAELCELQQFPENTEIVGFLEPTDDVFFIIEGRVAAKGYSAEGKEVTYAEISSGGIFGEFSAIDRQPRSATVETLENSCIVRMSSNNFRGLIAIHPSIGLKLAEHFVAKIRQLSRRVYEFSTMTVRHRVCSELLRMYEAAGGEEEAILVEPAPSHYQLATMLSTHREAVSREFSNLASKGIIEVGRQKLTILDARKLARMMQVELT